MTDDVGKLRRTPGGSTEALQDGVWVTVPPIAADMIERLSERCEAYKGQVEAGGRAIEHLRANSRITTQGLTLNGLRDAIKHIEAIEASGPRGLYETEQRIQMVLYSEWPNIKAALKTIVHE